MPVFTGPFHLLVVFGYFLMNLGFALFLRLGQYGWITCVSVLPLIPSFFWDTLFYRLFKTPARSKFKLYYTSNHFMSHDTARLIESFLLIPDTSVQRFDHQIDRDTSNTSNDPETGVKSRASTIWLFAEDSKGDIHYNYDAIVAVATVSPLLRPFLWILTHPGFARTAAAMADAVFLHTDPQPFGESPSKANIAKEQNRRHRMEQLDGLSPREFIVVVYRAVVLVAQQGFCLLLIFLIFNVNMASVSPNIYH